MFGNVATDATKKMIYTDSWKECSGRESGKEGYQFGDATRRIVEQEIVCRWKMYEKNIVYAP